MGRPSEVRRNPVNPAVRAAGFGGWLGVLIDRIGLPGRREVVRSSQVANADTAEG